MAGLGREVVLARPDARPAAGDPGLPGPGPTATRQFRADGGSRPAARSCPQRSPTTGSRSGPAPARPHPTPRGTRHRRPPTARHRSRSGYGQSPSAPGLRPAAGRAGLRYGSPTAGPGYGYQPGYPAYGYVPAARTNGLAIASLVCSLLWMFGLGAVLAIIFGFVARSQIKRSGDGQRGKGLALAGIIIGFAGLLATGLFIAVAVAVDHHCHQAGNCTFTTLNTET